MGRQVGPASTPVNEAAIEMFRENGWSDEVMPELLELFADAHGGQTDDRTSVFLSVLAAQERSRQTTASIGAAGSDDDQAQATHTAAEPQASR